MQRMDPERRQFLGTLATVGAASLLPAGVLTGQSGTRRIDVHQHFVSPSFHSFLTAKNTPATPIPGFNTWRDYSPARAVEELDRVGIETAMVSITAPGVWFGNADEARRLAREMNEFAAAKMVGDHKGRFASRAMAVRTTSGLRCQWRRMNSRGVMPASSDSGRSGGGGTGLAKPLTP